MRAAAKLIPFHNATFSPPFLINRPAPEPRSSQAMRLVTSNAASTVCAGFSAATTQAEIAEPGVDPQLCQSPLLMPPPPLLGGGMAAGAIVWNARVVDHGPM